MFRVMKAPVSSVAIVWYGLSSRMGSLNFLCREQKRQSFRALLGAQAQGSPGLVSHRQVLGWVEVAKTSALA